MRKLLLALTAALGCFSASAQTVSDFESPVLPKSDTFYVNYSAYGTDVGFTSGLAYFPCVYDTSFGFEYWASGFAYSNMTDTMTSGFSNSYAAKAGSGFFSKQYAVANGPDNVVRLQGTAKGRKLFGFYVNNSTYAYNSMRDGDGFAKKFKAADKDFFRLDVFAYRGGARAADSVAFYLADFRNSDTTKNYILKDWAWVDLTKLGNCDSVLLRLTSSDVGSFGMNTPAVFCIDNFTTNETGVAIKETPATIADFRIFPNPAQNIVHIASTEKAEGTCTVSDLSGRVMLQQSGSLDKAELDITALSSGTYVLQIRTDKGVALAKFVKQ